MRVCVREQASGKKQKQRPAARAASSTDASRDLVRPGPDPLPLSRLLSPSRTVSHLLAPPPPRLVQVQHGYEADGPIGAGAFSMVLRARAVTSGLMVGQSHSHSLTDCLLLAC